MDPSGIISIVSLVVAVGGTIVATINHTRIRSMCCGKKIEISLDVDKTVPSPTELKIKVPAEKELKEVVDSAMGR